MNHVDSDGEFALEANQECDRFVFRCASPPRNLGCRLRCALDRAGQFRMNQKRRMDAPQDGQCFPQIGLGHVAKFFDAAGYEEGLEPENSRIPERSNFRCVSWHNAAPKAHINMKLFPGRDKFFLEGRGAGGCGNTIERHFNQRGYAASCRGARCRLESFPFGSAGLVDVNVGVDEPGHDDGISRFENWGAGRKIVEIRDAGNDSVADMDSRWTDCIRQYDSSSANDWLPCAHSGTQCAAEQSVRKSSRRFCAMRRR